MTARLRRSVPSPFSTVVVVAFLVAGVATACTAQPDPAPTVPASAASAPASPAPDPEPVSEPVPQPDPEPTLKEQPGPDATPSESVIPYDPQSDYAGATPDELREYVEANDELIEAAIPSFEMQAGATPGPAAQDLLDRARVVAASVAPGVDLSEDELRPLLDAQERLLADMAG